MKRRVNHNRKDERNSTNVHNIDKTAIAKVCEGYGLWVLSPPITEVPNERVRSRTRRRRRDVSYVRRATATREDKQRAFHLHCKCKGATCVAKFQLLRNRSLVCSDKHV